MKIAFLVSPENPTPPTAYGGAERATDIWVRALMALGHEVTLYCGKGSTCPATKAYQFEAAMSSESEMASVAFAARTDYDVFVDYTAYHCIGQHPDSKVVSIMGGDCFMRYPHDSVRNKVYVSRAFAGFNGQHGHPVCPCPIEWMPSLARFNVASPGRFIYVGLICRMKGVGLAARAVAQIGEKLDVWGVIRDKRYYNTFKNLINFHGMLDADPKHRDDVFSATAFLHLTPICDAAPMAPREATLRGTPVITLVGNGMQDWLHPFYQMDADINVNQMGNWLEKNQSFLESDRVRQQFRKDALEYNDTDRLTGLLEEQLIRVVSGQTW